MGLLETLGIRRGKKAEEFESLEEALLAVLSGKPLEIFSVIAPVPQEYKFGLGPVPDKDGKVYLFVGVPVKVVLGQTVDASVNITPSGTSLDISGSFDLRNAVEIRLRRRFGYLTGGWDVYRTFSKKDVVAEWWPLAAAEGELFFLQQIKQVTQGGPQASSGGPVPEDLKERTDALNEIVARYNDRYIPL